MSYFLIGLGLGFAVASFFYVILFAMRNTKKEDEILQMKKELDIIDQSCDI